MRNTRKMDAGEMAVETGRIHLRGLPMNAPAPANATLTLIDQQGGIALNPAAALAAINALLPATAPALTESDLYLHTVEAVNSSYLPDRYAFLDSSTITNVASDAASGFAFMNAHRTGGWDISELPYGRTFAGQYEQGLTDTGQIVERSLVGFYLLRDHQPNGAGGLNTDQLQRSILGGTLFDVSVGLLRGAEGQVVCNVCGMAYRDCPHYRGWNDNMTLDEQIYARDVLGVPGGVATVRFVNWHANELSAVYDGAVAGAGF